MVASQDWPEVTKYAGLVCAQAHRQELIQDLFQTWVDPQKGLCTGGMIRFKNLLAFLFLHMAAIYCLLVMALSFFFEKKFYIFFFDQENWEFFRFFFFLFSADLTKILLFFWRNSSTLQYHKTENRKT